MPDMMIDRSSALVKTSYEPAPTLRRVIEILDADIVRPLTGERGLDVVVAGPVLHAADQTPFQPGAVILGVGLDHAGRAAAEAVRSAGHAGAAAVVFKVPSGADVDAATLAVAEAVDVGLLAVPPGLDWGHLFVLLRTAVSRSGPVLAAADTEVPAGDLFGFANAIADSVGGPVTIEDPRFNVLAYSSLDEPIDELRLQAILTRRTDEAWLKRLAEAGAISALWASPGVVRVDALTEWGLRPRLAIAVRAGQEILGSIWVAEGSRPLRQDAAATLEAAASTASLHLLRHRASEDLERSARRQALESLLEGRGSPEVVAERLGLEVGGDFTVIAFDLDAGEDSDVAARRERVLDLVSRYWEAFRRPAACTAAAGAVYALLPAGPSLSRERLVAACEAAVEHVSASLRAPVWAGIGSTVSGLAAVPKARREADQVLRTLGGVDGPRVRDIETTRTKVFLLEVERLFARHDELMEGKLMRLVEHDAAHNTSYVESLAAYLDAFGDVSAAADAVIVHSKTFRYRLKRIRELSGMDLDDPSERLVAHLQLRRLLGGPGNHP